ncbi:unnamed protein product [Linum trigynum]|uniref:Uncharacterized protein n=1 Tax=Linum trigynum TaxID=586398 RepID=A0AAV2ENQ6_9ROSI
MLKLAFSLIGMQIQDREGLLFQAFTAKTRIGPPPPFDDDGKLPEPTSPGEPTSPRGTTTSRVRLSVSNVNYISRTNNAGSFSASASRTATEDDSAKFLRRYESQLRRDEFIALLKSGNIGILIPLAKDRSETDFVELLKEFAGICLGGT